MSANGGLTPRIVLGLRPQAATMKRSICIHSLESATEIKGWKPRRACCASLTRRAHACVGSKKSNRQIEGEPTRAICFRAAARSAFDGGAGRRSKTQSCSARLRAGGPDGPRFATLFFACPRSGPSRSSRPSFFDPPQPRAYFSKRLQVQAQSRYQRKPLPETPCWFSMPFWCCQL